MTVSTTKAYIRSLRSYSDDELKSAAEAMQQAAAAFGQPHLHKGIGIRRITKKHFECRSGLGLRLVFLREQETLVFIFAGNHDDVQSFLRNVR